jgi:protein tyrosine phosphatase (PTP) superfamily phosphohydrolase (DUF442 family)
MFFVGTSEGGPTPDNRPLNSGKSIQMEGLPNFCKVSDDLLRCAQPTLNGMLNLKGIGIKTVVNLSAFHSDGDMLKNTGLNYEHIPMIAWPLIPEEWQVVKFLSIVTDPKRTPVLVHCQHGADRTGTMCAVYRIVVQGWTKEDAIKEMTDGGFGFHRPWGSHLIQWINDLDVARIRQKAGIKNCAESAGDDKNHFRKQVYPFQIFSTLSNISFNP